MAPSRHGLGDEAEDDVNKTSGKAALSCQLIFEINIPSTLESWSRAFLKGLAFPCLAFLALFI